MKNICFCNTTEFWGGGEKLFLEYALLFQQKGYNVFVVSNQKSHLFEEAKRNKISVFHLAVGDFSFTNPLKINKLKSFFTQNQIDTVFFITSEDVKTGSIAAHRANVERIVYLRGLAVRIKNSFVNRLVFKKYLTHIIANSEETKRLAIGQFSSPQIHAKVKVIYHGIDLDLFADKTSSSDFNYNQKEGEIIIGNAGRLTEQKGQIHLIEVAKKLKEKGGKFKLVIAGTGELETELKAKIKLANLEEHVLLLGFVKDIPGFMHSLDIFALSSMWEGFGFVIAEAMAAEKPVVAFDLTSNPEVVHKDESGFLVEYPNVEEFANKLALLCEDENLRLKMGKAGRKYVEEKFQISVVNQQLEDYLKSN